MENVDKFYKIPETVYKKCSPFEEFKQDVSFVTVQLKNNEVYEGVLVLYPNFIIAMEGKDDIPFSPDDIIDVYQTEKDLKRRSSSDWKYWRHPWDGKSK